MQNRVQKKKKISLTTMIFIALLAGALAGVIINYLIPSNYVVDDIIVQGVFYIVAFRLYSAPSSAEAWQWEIRKSLEASV